MNDCHPKILVEGAEYNIAQCPHCNRVGLYYHNFLIGFEFDEFRSFSRAVLKVNFDEVCVEFPNGLDHVVLNTCHKDIQLSFSRAEFDEFTCMLNQALLLLAADSHVKSN